MDLATETRWREGLEEAGREAVQRYLTARPGAAEDPVDEFVFEAPYPTRAFCRDWCAEKDSIIYEVSSRSIFIGVLVAIIAIGGSFALGDIWNSVNHPVPTKTASATTNGYGPTNSGGGGGGRRRWRCTRLRFRRERRPRRTRAQCSTRERPWTRRSAVPRSIRRAPLRRSAVPRSLPRGSIRP